jgi:hypothetical protein
MARKKIPVCVNATHAAIWFCEDDHLHIELADHNENPIAEISLDFDDAAEILADLVSHIGFVLVDPDDIQIDGDTIGQTAGNA